MNTMRAIVIGAGIAGTATGIFLRREGFDVALFEQRNAQAEDEGQFLSIAPNGLQVLDELGLGDEVRHAGLPTERLRFMNGSGRRLGSVALGIEGRASITLKRAELHRILQREAVLCGVDLKHGTRFDGIEQAGLVRARFDDGSSATGNLLIGTDGLWSPVRRALFPDAPEPRATGLTSCGGFAHGVDLPPSRDGMTMIFGRRAFFGYMVSPAREVYWFSTVESRAVAPRSPDFRERLQHTLLELHAGDGDVVNQIIRATSGAIGAYAIQDIPTLAHWVRGNAVVIGDAAHATSPHGGQGASMALEDAWVLSDALRQRRAGEAIELALRRFQRQRQARVERVVEWSRRNGGGKVAGNAVQRWVRDLAMPLVLRHAGRQGAHDWLYDFQPAPFDVRRA